MGKSPVKAHLGEAQKVNLVSGRWNFLVELTKGRSLPRAAWRNCCRFACPVGLCRGANGWGRKDFRAAELWEDLNGAWWLASVVTAPGRQKQENDHELHSVLHHTVSSYSTLTQQSETLSRKKIATRLMPCKRYYFKIFIIHYYSYYYCVCVWVCKGVYVCAQATHQRTHFGSWFSPSTIGSLQTQVIRLVQEACFPLSHLTRQNVCLCGVTREQSLEDILTYNYGD